MSQPRLHVCLGCRPKGQSVEQQERALGQLRRDLADCIEVVTYPCLSGCQQRGRVSLGSSSRWSWLLGNVNLADDREALLQLVRTWITHEDGMLKKAERPVSLHRKVLGRLPPPGEKG